MMKLLLFIVLPLLLLIGAAGGAFMTGMIPGLSPAMLFGGGDEMTDPKDMVPPPSSQRAPLGTDFYTLEEFVVNVRTKRSYPVFLLASITVETADETVRVDLGLVEPRIRDAMIVFLSGLTPAELNGYDGIQRVRTGAWRILNTYLDRDLLVNVQVGKLTVK
ncbi:MAG: flagellar basal body-associated FliL family protein [Alphaproteobacteria bacterium]|nr:flagellar basal body-associated FliL family protein [Alphaproteobacteria bacterium]